MANPWGIPAVGWGIVFMGWLLSPMISFLVNKFFAYLAFDVSRKLRDLELKTIPTLKLQLRDVVQQRMQKTTKNKKGYESDIATLEKMENDLKSTLYEAEDILDLVDYYRIERKVLRDRSWVRVQVQHLLIFAGTCIIRCKGSWFGRCIESIGATLLRCAKGVGAAGKWFGRCVECIGATLLQCAKGVGAAGRWFRRCVESIGATLLQCAKGVGAAGRWFRRCVECIGATLLQCEEHKHGEHGEAAVLELHNLELGEGLGVAGEAQRTEGVEAASRVQRVDHLPKRTASDAVSLDGAHEHDLASPNAEEAHAEDLGPRLRPDGLAELEDAAEHGPAGVDHLQLAVIGAWSNSVVQRLRAWSQSLDIKALSRSMKRWVLKTHAGACYYRDWSYEGIGVKSNQNDDTAANSFLSVIEGRRLKKRIEQIENIVSDSKKSHLLNEDSSSSKILVKDTNNKESGSTQEEIDDLHRGIKWEVFGREKDREDICNMLRKGSDAYGSKPYSVIGIHGITGSGKSTLAQYVCDHEKKAKDKHFDLIMFSHVSMTFRVDKIFRDMLEQITQDQPSDISDLKSLQMKLKEKLEGKRFLLVLDDLWVNNENQKGLDILLDALNAGQSGSKILVTAQREDAAATLRCVQKQISIPNLDDKDYLSLFMHHARPGAVNDDGNYRRIGRKIANKLHLSPIAAVTVGKQLQRNARIDFWKTTANDDVLNKNMGALWWSYQQLGPDIRDCFAYCSTFPKGYRFERVQLIHIWIAQGFVSTRSDAIEELEDVGNRYFNELITVLFLMQVKRELLYTKEQFTIHDRLHELAEMVAGCDFHRIGLDWSPKDIPQGVRHVFIETNNVAEIAENYLDLGNLRTLIIKVHWTDTYRNHDLEKVFESLFMRMTKLRVLIVELNHDTKASSVPVPASIDQMKHLRYFRFKYKEEFNHLTLPSTISKLYHMQTIEVLPRYCDVSCPEDMSNLIHLRHISGSLVFPNVGRLTSLRTLPRFEVRKERGYELKQLKHLNKLRGTLAIDALGVVGSKEEALEAHLTQKKRLTKLELSFRSYLSFRCYWSRDQDIVAEVFEGLCPPEDLQELRIRFYKCPSLRYPSWMLSRQHPDAPKCLQTLQLYRCCRLASIPEDSGLFQRLLELRIYVCEWDSLPDNMERLVSLQTLTISGCRKMHFLPMLPQSLREIEINCCGVLSTTCKEEGHENWHKIQHIPEKFIA